MKVLISGSHGFVGRHFVKRLLSDGHEVVAVDDLSSGLSTQDWPKSVKVTAKEHERLWTCCDDIRNIIRRNTFLPDEFGLIIHCAAVVGGRAKIEGDPIGVATDLAIDADFWNWVVKSKNKKQKIVYFSSSAIYPVDLQTPLSHHKLAESMVDLRMTRIGKPDQTYGWAKLTGEYLAQHAVKTYDTNVHIYRPFSGYGEDQSLDYPFPSIVKRVVDREHPITVWGNGNQVRDWIHIDDIVEGVLSTLHLPAGTVMNLGSGIGTSFRDLVTLACELAGHKSVISPQPEKPSGVHRRQADVFFMRQYFTPKIGLEEGVARMISYLDRQRRL